MFRIIRKVWKEQGRLFRVTDAFKKRSGRNSNGPLLGERPLRNYTRISIFYYLCSLSMSKYFDVRGEEYLLRYWNGNLVTNVRIYFSVVSESPGSTAHLRNVLLLDTMCHNQGRYIKIYIKVICLECKGFRHWLRSSTEIVWLHIQSLTCFLCLTIFDLISLNVR